MCDRKETTTNEDYWIVVREIFDKKQEFKFLHIIDRFSITNQFWLTLGFTKIFNVIQFTLSLINVVCGFRTNLNFWLRWTLSGTRKCRHTSWSTQCNSYTISICYLVLMCRSKRSKALNCCLKFFTRTNVSSNNTIN